MASYSFAINSDQLLARARNRRLLEQGQLLRAEIFAIVASHSPTAPVLTAKIVRAQLRRDKLPSLRTIQWHLRAIRNGKTTIAVIR